MVVYLRKVVPAVDRQTTEQGNSLSAGRQIDMSGGRKPCVKDVGGCISSGEYWIKSVRRDVPVIYAAGVCK